MLHGNQVAIVTRLWHSHFYQGYLIKYMDEIFMGRVMDTVCHKIDTSLNKCNQNA
jgi:hypothetical protein